MPFNKRTEEATEEFYRARREFLTMHGGGASIKVARRQRRSTRK